MWFLSALGLFVAVLVCLAVAQRVYNWYIYGPPRGVPMPPSKIPVFGHTIEVFRNFRTRHLLIEKWAREYGDIAGIVALQVSIEKGGYLYLLTDPQAIKETMLKRPNTYTRPQPSWTVLPPGLFGITDPVEWGRVRRLTAPAFSHANVGKMLPPVNAVVKNLVRKWCTAASSAPDGGQVDALKDFYAYTFDVISLVGFDHHLNAIESEHSQFVDDVMTLLKQQERYAWVSRVISRILPPSEKVRRAFERFMGLMQDAIGQYAQTVRDEDMHHKMNSSSISLLDSTAPDTRNLTTLLAKMMTALDDDSDRSRLSEMELMGNILTFFVAGTDTTANTLSWAAHLLATTPDVQQKAYDEISAAACRPGGLEALFDASNDKIEEVLGNFPYTEAIIWETLRLHGPAPLIISVARQPVTICGFDFPAGATFAPMMRLLITNEKYMPRASEFIPERWLDGYAQDGQRLVPEDPTLMQWIKNLPFGGGPRICPGKLLAIAEATLALVGILHRLELRPVPGLEEPAERIEFTVKPDQVKVIVRLRAHEGQ